MLRCNEIEPFNVDAARRWTNIVFPEQTWSREEAERGLWAAFPELEGTALDEAIVRVCLRTAQCKQWKIIWENNIGPFHTIQSDNIFLILGEYPLSSSGVPFLQGVDQISHRIALEVSSGLGKAGGRATDL